MNESSKTLKALGRKVRGTHMELPASVARLSELGFDPMANMVDLYHRLDNEDKFWRDIRGKNKITLIEGIPTGLQKKTVKYSSLAHMSVLTNMVNINNDLMRYAYARVPEPREDSYPKDTGGLTLILADEDEDNIIEGEFIDADY